MDDKLLEEDGVYKIELKILSNRLCMMEIIPVNDETDTYIGYKKEEFYGIGILIILI